jgi:hypothetical protein
MAYEGTGGLEQPLEGSSDVVLRLRLGQVAVDVVDGALEDVEIVPELVELGAGHDQLGVAEPELLGPGPCLIRQLPTALRTPPTSPACAWPPLGQATTATIATQDGFDRCHTPRSITSIDVILGNCHTC